VVTAPSTNKRWRFNGTAWVKNPYFRQPWWAQYVEYGFVVGPPALAGTAIVAPEAAVVARIASSKTSKKLFARGSGILNRNNVVRIGQGWKGTAEEGKLIFRISIGHRNCPTIPGLPSFPWHIP
jgi:hypothetical protein